ncbi:hypothetical protein [Pseudofrankia inefficax]|uniref:hypothetical protein n=1 Tax=Pseudofrankia inefficax (strain DSM 45817 / CECT 9037 / DDB 130130 / EuI1c) TaxID=298654 RepID=UPI00059E59B8|nr:hypothetical protein [Pseudofrankia inefficax]
MEDPDVAGQVLQSGEHDRAFGFLPNQLLGQRRREFAAVQRVEGFLLGVEGLLFGDVGESVVLGSGAVAGGAVPR